MVQLGNEDEAMTSTKSFRITKKMVLEAYLHVWGTSRKGNTVVRQFTAKERLARSLKAFNQRCRRMRHWPVKAQHQRLCRMLQGHYGYFGITGNFRRLIRVHREVQRLWRRWLSRRSSRSHVTWERFERVLQRFATGCDIRSFEAAELARALCIYSIAAGQ
jgi:hypothetical protein